MIKRTILSDLIKHLSEPEITVLIGPRQVGKTYLMRLLEDHLAKTGEKTVFLNLDVEDHMQFFTSQSTLINYLELQVGQTHAFIFIDEIQRKKDAGLFLKGIYDMNLPYKFIVSGSGSLDIKARVKESMAGRKRLFFIDPVSFEEFVNFKTDYKYENKLQEFFNIESAKTQNMLLEYMKFGGYPKVILADTASKKKIEMDEIYRSYIERDINSLLGVEKPDAFTNLLKIMASQIGSLVNITELSSTIGISVKTIQHYLYYLEETFVIKKVTPYYRNFRSEITKSPMYFFYDTGLRNYLVGLFGLPLIPQVFSGHLFENFIYNKIRQDILFANANIHFWRTRDDAEVDFVINTGAEIIPVETKYTKIEKFKISRSFRSFLSKYQPKEGFIVHLGNNLTNKIKNTKIHLIPYWQSSNITKSF